MNNNQTWNNTGEQIKIALSDALNTGDFKELNTLVAQSVTVALNEVGIHVNTSSSQSNTYAGGADNEGVQQNAIPLWQQRAWERAQKKQNKLRQDWQNRLQNVQNNMENENPPSHPYDASLTGTNNTSQYDRQVVNELARTQQGSMVKFPSVKMRRVGKVSNVLYQVFGGIGLGITGLITFIRLFVFLAGETTLGGWIVNFIFLAIFYGMIRLGVGQRHRLKRAVRYVQLCGHKMYEDVENLAKAIGKNVHFVAKDLHKMLELGFFPEGHLDEHKTCLMLNDSIYRQYLETENNVRRMEEEKRLSLPQEENLSSTQQQASQETMEEQTSELDTIITEGMECIRKLRDLNDRISGEIISAKLFRLENLLKDIFDSLKEHPEQMHRMHKLMSYYLPTTLKLVEAYENFDRISSPGSEILKAKAEIENTLETINQAFTELLNNLFQDTVFDVTTDAQVLKTMLAREGLMREMELVPRQEQDEPKQPQYMRE